MVDMLATYIWQVTIIHSLDHAAMYEFYRKMLGFTSMSIQEPFVPYSNTEYWNKVALSKLKEAKENWGKYFDKKDVESKLEEIKRNPEKYLIEQKDIE